MYDSGSSDTILIAVTKLVCGNKLVNSVKLVLTVLSKYCIVPASNACPMNAVGGGQSNAACVHEVQFVLVSRT